MICAALKNAAYLHHLLNPFSTLMLSLDFSLLKDSSFYLLMFISLPSINDLIANRCLGKS